MLMKAYKCRILFLLLSPLPSSWVEEGQLFLVLYIFSVRRFLTTFFPD